MKKDILIIDYISPLGHENFDFIHIDSIYKLGHKITLVGKEGQFDNLNHNKYPDLVIEYLPKWCFAKPSFLKPLILRLQGILTLLYIMVKHPGAQFDYTIFLCYDILSVFFYRSSNKVILIDHNNIGQLENGIKLKLTKMYNEEAHICLSTYMQERLSELLSGHKIEHVPHGLIKSDTIISKPTYVKDEDVFIFCPINRNFDPVEVSEIINSSILESYLRERNIVLYIKPIDGVVENKFIRVIKNRIPNEEYNYLIKKSLAVLLPYTHEFKFRCSGIFFECVANDTPLICLTNPTINSFANIVDMYIFDDESQLVSCIQECLVNGKRLCDKSIFSPLEYWKHILNN